MKTRLLIFALFVLLFTCANSNSTARVNNYSNIDMAINDRVTNLLKQMTLEEKMAQMFALNDDFKSLVKFDQNGDVNLDDVKINFPLGVGHITRLSEIKGGNSQTSTGKSEPLTPYEHARLSNAIQKYFIEETRLGIPVIFHEESLHGLAAYYATSFPQPIAMASSFNPELIEEVYSVMAKETRLRGAHQVLSPVVDIARDARWGRVEETFGEDPHLTTVIGNAAIKGFQGDNTFSDNEHVLATLKHFAAHGQPEGGINTAPANYSERVLRESHFAPFRNIMNQNKILSVMATYHELDGVPAHANKWLLNDILREEWGFEGYVVSDYFAIRELNEREGVYAHCVAEDGKHAAELAIKAGVNMELPFLDCYKYIPELVKEGIIPIETIDQLVGQILNAKFELGLFDNPYIDPNKAADYCGSEQNRSIALKVALESVVLLKNKKEIVPLNKNKIKKIAVVGPNANRILLGGYSGTPNYNSTLLEGINSLVANEVEIVYAEGCGLTIGGSWSEDQVVFSTLEQDSILINSALETVKNADVIILAVGGNELTSREAWSNTHLGDRSNLDLIGRQNLLIDELYKTGIPIVSLAFNGRPLAFNNLVQKSEALFECWYLGQESGIAAAKVLFGEYNPGGKLPITFPRSVGHLPVFYNHKPSARRGYLNDDISPLFPFGFGQSYTKFEISNIELSDTIMSVDSSFKVSATLRNVGKLAGSEVVQVYIRDKNSSVTRPVKELKAFRKVYLEPGETKIIDIQIDNSALAFYDINMDFTVEAGEFNVMVGTSSDDNDLTTLNLFVQ